MVYTELINQYNLDIMEVKNTLRFFREFFCIPQSVKMGWCILLEFKHGFYTMRLGVMLEGTDKAIDVASRCFVQLGRESEVYYKALLAVRTPQDDSYLYRSGDISMTKPKSYVTDIYFRCVYSPELKEAVLL